MSVAEAIYKETCHVCDVVGRVFNNFLKKVQYSRQMTANKKVAEQLVHLGFHNQKEYSQILQRMNDKTINEYHGKY